MSARRLEYSSALETWDTASLLDALADDALIRVAVHDQPLQGRDVAEFLFGILREELGPITVTDEVVDGDLAVVMFETSIRGQSTQGLNVLRRDESGPIQELTVFFRPLAALGLIAEVVGARMAERFGPPPE
jgi:hypothetical protein